MEHDVAIAGAGPAGAHLALRLARLGWSVALLDREVFPRPKPCGEFLSPACLPFLEELELASAVHRAGAVRVPGMRLSAGTVRTVGRYRSVCGYGVADGESFGLGVRREVLDALAVATAEREPGITVLQGWSVSEVTRRDDGRVTGLVARDPSGERRELASRFVVGADGPRSRVARSLGWVRPVGGRPRFAVTARFQGVEPAAHADVAFVGRDFFGACPIDGPDVVDGSAGTCLTANLVVDASELPPGRGALEPWFRGRLREAPALWQRLEGSELDGELAVCGPLRVRTTRTAGPGVALVGDAAGFVDPLTGEGVYFAMLGARLLAVALDAALAEPESEAHALAGYARARRRELAPRQALARLFQVGLRSPAVPRLAVAAMERVPGLCDLALALTGDYLPTRALLRPATWRTLFRQRERLRPPATGPSAAL